MFFKRFIFMSTSVVPAYMHGYQVPKEVRRWYWLLWNWNYRCCEPLYGCWELNLGPLQGQHMLQTAKPFLQPPASNSFFFFFLINLFPLHPNTGPSSLPRTPSHKFSPIPFLLFCSEVTEAPKGQTACSLSCNS